MLNPSVLVAIGIVVGVYSGIMGLGGGTIMIPVMVFALGFTQHQAVATSLAVMMVPVTSLAVLGYWREGQVNVQVAVWIALGFAGGGLLGQMIASRMPEQAMKLIFGFVVIYVGAQMVFGTLGREHLARTMLVAALLTALGAGMYLGLRWHDRKPPNAVAEGGSHVQAQG